MKRFLLLLITACIISCKEDSPIFPEGFGPNQPNVVTYQPMFNSASWVYTHSTDFGSSTQIQNMPGNKINFGGKAFYEAVNLSLEDSTIEKSYFSIKNHIYTLRSESTDFQMGLELEYLNDTAKVNHTWSRDFLDDSESEETRIKRITTVILGKDMTKTVHGKTYKNVIHTRLTVSISGMDDFEEVARYDFYIAKAIGIIQVDSEGDWKSSKQLKSFSVM